ncbi:MAG: FAD-dependent monooxygenase [Sciscionella sp.]
MDAPVVIIGAGPAGLMLAGELRLAGIEVIVVERLEQPTGESRGLGFTARTMEVFDQRGLLPRFGEIETSSYGHFGGLPVDFGVLDGAHYAAKTVPQAQTEAMIAEWATELGADIRRGHELVGLADDDHGVDVRVRGPRGNVHLRAGYLVGCDGGRSTVRKLAGFDFPGTAATREMFIADVRGCQMRPRVIGETVPGGMAMGGPIGDGIDRIVVCENGTPPRKRTESPGFDEVADAWQRLTGEDIHHGTPLWISSFGDATRQVTEYRRGRVILSGDAAHIHLPAGGQGMNTSIQDSVNLGWKLAATVRGWAPPGLLDSYHTERHAVGVRLLMNTQAQGLLFLSGSEVTPLRDVLAELIGFDDVTRHLAGMVTGLAIEYDVGPGDHPLLGRRMPHQDLLAGSRRTSTTELLHTGRGVLLDLTGDAGLREVALPWADRVDIVTATPQEYIVDSQLSAVRAALLRPDGHVGWIAPGSEEDLSVAISRWFGAPVPRSPDRRDERIGAGSSSAV